MSPKPFSVQFGNPGKKGKSWVLKKATLFKLFEQEKMKSGHPRMSQSKDVLFYKIKQEPGFPFP